MIKVHSIIRKNYSNFLWKNNG